MDKSVFLDKWEEVSQCVHAIVMKYNGSISAEHGIGKMKRQMLREMKSEVELDLMRTIRQAIDPRGILNPGKLL